MNNDKEERLKIAVFIDFDNIAIGVKQSLNRNFDVGTVLEAIKEKGQVVTKIAYGDWKRNEDFSRAMTQHAVQMVQRNLTPGGDKNGADIALALDALEMAFTRDHINAFVIVGGDSDFIALVEKLKQYDKVVFVVGGRAFTSVILQKNCHEFISYENLIGVQSGIRRSTGKAQMLSSPASLETALPLIRRSLKILSDREVSPQLGLLKSTLLQLDSTFSERDYGVSSFRDFTQKLANAGYVHLKQVDRSLLVELKEVPEGNHKAVPESSAEVNEQASPDSADVVDSSVVPGQPSEATRVLQELLRESKSKPHWPLYLRTFKQFLRTLQPTFDEHQFGITSTYDLVRQAQKDGLLRVERNRQGILRIYPGELFPRETTETVPEEPVQDGKAKPERKKFETKETQKTKLESEKAEAESAKSGTEKKEPGVPSKDSKTQKPKSVKSTKTRTKSTKSAKAGTKSRKSPKTEEIKTTKSEIAEAEEADTEKSAASEKASTKPASEAASETQSATAAEQTATESTNKKTTTKQKRKTSATKTRARKTATRKTKSAKEKSG
ncbi:MAG: NYN domain-containing protein [Acidobacteriota bacterium]|jgi:uncharacterized LabA/DUF88 family protein